MTKAKTPSIVTLNLGAALRWALLAPALLAIAGSWFAVRWYVGNTIAEYSPEVAQDGIEMARMAVRWAPGDPLAHWRLGSLEEKAFSAENMAAAVGEYQTAVRLSPNDYRYWMELGRALEGNGDRASGEKALRRSVELAPAYSHPRWHFGNLLLRAGKYDEAFAQLGHAAESDNQMRRQVFDLAMQVFDRDVNEIVRVACVSPAARMQFANYLATNKAFDQAMNIWNSVGAAERGKQMDLNKEFERTLIDAKQYHATLTVMREVEPDTVVPEPEQVHNGGFEGPLPATAGNLFDWVIEARASVQTAIDGRAHSGQKGLRVSFRAARSLEKIPISQTVVVEPGVAYRFECFVLVEDLVSPSTPILVVLDAVDGSTLGSSKPIPSGSSDWQPFTFDFTTPPGHDGVTIGLQRAPCVEGQVCPIFGTIWYDDFSIKRITGPVPRRDAGNSKR